MVPIVILLMLNLVVSGVLILRAPPAPGDLADILSRRDPREYRPVWWDGQLQREVWANPALIESGDASVAPVDDAGIEQLYRASAKTESVIALRPLYFPGWVARVDGERREIAANEGGHIQIKIKPGDHTIELRFKDTRPRVAGKIVSAVGVMILLTLLLVARRRMTALKSTGIVPG